MPTSKDFGKTWIEAVYTDLCKRSEVSNVIDIGVGRGTYSLLFRNTYKGARWVGVEAWGPYVEQYSLREKYDEIVIGDARSLDFDKFGHFDIAFIGDVLEHMNKREALRLVNKALAAARIVFVSVPVIYAPQNEYENNPFENHVKPDWCHQEAMTSIPAIRAWYVEGINGVYVSALDSNDTAVLTDILKRMDKTVIKNKTKFGYGRISNMSRFIMRAYYIVSKPLRPFYYSARRKLGMYKKRWLT